MRLSTALTLTLITLLLLIPVGVIGTSPAVAGSSAPATVDGQSTAHSAGLESTRALAPAESRQVISIQVTDDGAANWTVESRFLLEDDDDVDEFLTFANEVTSGERETDMDVETFERFRSIAQDNVDREMEVTNAGWDEPRIENASETDGETKSDTNTGTNINVGNDDRIGVISYSFTWTNFAEKDGNRIHLGDVFQYGDSTWFPRLTDSQQLVIERPPNYGYEHHEHSLTDGNLVWNGPHEFDATELTVIYLEGASVGTEGPGTGSSILSQATLGFGLLVLLVLVGSGGYYFVTRSSSDDDSAGVAANRAGDGIATDGSATRESMAASSGAAEPSTTETESSTASADETNPVPEVDDDVDVELLSDEERVHRLLRQNSGRMKQASIVKETGWSNAKVSQLLSKMDEDEEIEKLRIGRENLITHPEVDPTEVD